MKFSESQFILCHLLIVQIPQQSVDLHFLYRHRFQLLDLYGYEYTNSSKTNQVSLNLKTPHRSLADPAIHTQVCDDTPVSYATADRRQLFSWRSYAAEISFIVCKILGLTLEIQKSKKCKNPPYFVTSLHP